MKRIFTASALVLALGAGSLALAGPGHDHGEKKPTKTTKPEKRSAPTLKELFPDVKAPKTPDLWIGSDAPALQIAKFINGEPVTEFKEGQVYVVEFWATWCGPCITAFPHLSELQESYGDKVRFLGVNVWENETGEERIEMITDFVAKHSDNMRYTVAIEVDGKMSETWLRPAGQNGIPAAFIVDQKGKIAWVGHPMGMDKPLEEIVAGKFDPKKAAEMAFEGELIRAGFMKFQELANTGEDYQLMHDITMALINDHFADEPQGLNAIAWIILNSEAENMQNRAYMIAHKAATLAAEATEWKDWSVLDTYALACMKTGNAREAAKWQQKAIDYMPAEEAQLLPELERRLAEYKAAAED